MKLLKKIGTYFFGRNLSVTLENKLLIYSPSILCCDIVVVLYFLPLYIKSEQTSQQRLPAYLPSSQPVLASKFDMLKA